MIHFVEMAVFRRERTKLPVVIWIDRFERNLKHKVPRLKFQNNTSNGFTNERDLIPISIEDNPVVLIKDFKSKISAKDLQTIKDFISRNKELILRFMSDPKLDEIDFLTSMKMV